MMMTVLAHISDSLTTAINGVVRKNMRLVSLAKTLIIITNFSFLITNLCACSTIDDDLSNCHNAELDYELRLVTNMTTELKTELQTELSTQADLQMAAALRSHLQDIFTDMDGKFFPVKQEILCYYPVCIYADTGIVDIVVF